MTETRITIEKTYIAGLGGFAALQIGSLAWDLIPAVLGLISPLLQIEQLGSDLCNAGLGTLLMIGLWLLALKLFLMAWPDIAKGFEQRGSKSSGAQQQKSGSFTDGGIKFVGAIVVANLPVFLATAGFSFLSCVDAINIFN